MFKIDDDMTINVTRGDCGTIDVSATVDGAVYVFLPGDILRLKVFEKKNCENVVLKKDFGIDVNATTVTLTLTGKDTKIGGMINKPTNYWYEIELNPETNPQTIVGYDDEGPKLFCLHPEGNEVEETEPEEADVGAFDDKLDLTSNKALPNKVIAQAFYSLQGKVKANETGKISVLEFGAVGDGDKDDTKAIQQAVSSLKDGDVLYFPKGHYKVAHDYHITPQYEKYNQSVIKIVGKKNITIDLNDSVIELMGKYDSNGSVVDSDAVGYNLFDIIDCEKFVIKNGTLMGDRLSHNYDKYNTLTHEVGYGLFIRSNMNFIRTSGYIENGVVKNPNGINPYNKDTYYVGVPTSNVCSGEVLNVNFCDFTGDGIVVKNGMSYGTIKIKGCEIFDCRRQGISVLDSDVVIIDDCYIHDIGLPYTHKNGSVKQGTRPMTGIDIEPNAGTYCVNECIIKNTTIDNCGSCSIVTSYQEHDGKISNILKNLRIDNCKTQTLSLFPYMSHDGGEENVLPIKITNSIISHHDCTKYMGANRVICVANGELINCVINSAKEDIYNNSMQLFTCDHERAIKLENCVLNALNTVRIGRISCVNTTVNGGTIHMHSINQELHIRDCINTVFNNCKLNTTAALGLYKFVNCSFLNCDKSVNQ